MVNARRRRASLNDFGKDDSSQSRHEFRHIYFDDVFISILIAYWYKRQQARRVASQCRNHSYLCFYEIWYIWYGFLSYWFMIGDDEFDIRRFSVFRLFSSNIWISVVYKSIRQMKFSLFRLYYIYIWIAYLMLINMASFSTPKYFKASRPKRACRVLPFIITHNIMPLRYATDHYTPCRPALIKVKFH